MTFFELVAASDIWLEGLAFSIAMIFGIYQMVSYNKKAEEQAMVEHGAVDRMVVRYSPAPRVSIRKRIQVQKYSVNQYASRAVRVAV